MGAFFRRRAATASIVGTSGAGVSAITADWRPSDRSPSTKASCVAARAKGTVKNTLTKIAAKDAGIDGFDGLLAGPTAIAFIQGDPVAAAKAIDTFAAANPALIIKGGMMDGKVLTAADVKKLANDTRAATERATAMIGARRRGRVLLLAQAVGDEGVGLGVARRAQRTGAVGRPRGGREEECGQQRETPRRPPGEFVQRDADGDHRVLQRRPEESRQCDRQDQED